MPRSRRSWTPHVGAHFISRFVDRRFYLVGDSDRRELLEAIARANHRWDWTWISWALMSSHVHYGLAAGTVDPDRFFRSAHTCFAQGYHRQRSGRTLGPVFADRPKLYPVGRSELARLVAYHHRNPVSAGVVTRASESRWTSHRVYLRLDPAPSWFDVERAFHLVGFEDDASGRRAFDEFVMDVDLSDRAASQGQAPMSSVILAAGSPDVDWDHVVALGREVTQLPSYLPIDSRKRPAALARLVIAEVATTDLGQTYASTAQALGMSTGGLFNLLVRGRERAGVRELTIELRQRLSCNMTKMTNSVPYIPI